MGINPHILLHITDAKQMGERLKDWRPSLHYFELESDNNETSQKQKFQDAPYNDITGSVEMNKILVWVKAKKIK